MKARIATTTTVFLLFGLSACSMQDEQRPAPAAPAPAPAAAAKAATKAPAKAKVEKTRGDIGLIDTEKNYLILVTKQGKLITLDFDQKTKVTKLTPTPAKMSDIGLGNAATVVYQKAGGKNIASKIEYRAKK